MKEVTQKQYNDALNIIDLYLKQERKRTRDIKEKIESFPKVSEITPKTLICDLKLSARIVNNIKSCYDMVLEKPFDYYEITVKDLSKITKIQMYRTMGFGFKSVEKLESIVRSAGLKMATE